MSTDLTAVAPDFMGVALAHVGACGECFSREAVWVRA